MSVLMTLRVKGDMTQLEALAEKDPTVFPTVSGKGKEMGATYHRFYATDTEILVIDAWPDEATFQKFFDSTPEIGEVMAKAGVTTPPEITFWREVDLGDGIG